MPDLHFKFLVSNMREKQLLALFVLVGLLVASLVSAEVAVDGPKDQWDNITVKAEHVSRKLFRGMERSSMAALGILKTIPADIVAFATDNRSNMSVVEENTANAAGLGESETSAESSDLEMDKNDVEGVFKKSTKLSMQVMRWLNRMFVDLLKEVTKLYARLVKHLHDNSDLYAAKVAATVGYTTNVAKGTYKVLSSRAKSSWREFKSLLDEYADIGAEIPAKKLEKRGSFRKLKQSICRRALSVTLNPIKQIKKATKYLQRRFSLLTASKSEEFSSAVNKYGGIAKPERFSFIKKTQDLGTKLVKTLEQGFDDVEEKICSEENVLRAESVGSTTLSEADKEALVPETEKPTLEEVKNARKTNTVYFRESSVAAT